MNVDLVVVDSVRSLSASQRSAGKQSYVEYFLTQYPVFTYRQHTHTLTQNNESQKSCNVT